MARTLDFLGYDEAFVFDPHRMIRERYGKAYSRRLRVVSAGAFERIRWHRVDDPSALVSGHDGRTIATVADSTAASLYTFCFNPDDLLIFGSEAEGLPRSIVAAASAAVTIPLQGCTRSLNLAVAASIFLFEASRQLAGQRNRSNR